MSNFVELLGTANLAKIELFQNFINENFYVICD